MRKILLSFSLLLSGCFGKAFAQSITVNNNFSSCQAILAFFAHDGSSYSTSGILTNDNGGLYALAGPSGTYSAADISVLDVSTAPHWLWSPPPPLGVTVSGSGWDGVKIFVGTNCIIELSGNGFQGWPHGTTSIPCGCGTSATWSTDPSGNVTIDLN